MSFKYIGKPTARIDGWEKANGTAIYAFDIELPGMLYAKLVRSPYPHARIIEVNGEDARRQPGVVRIVSGKDVPYKLGIYVGDRDILATEKALWAGHPVAAVVAKTLEAAEKAVELVRVKYEPLDPVLDPLEALKPGAPIVHERLGEYRKLPVFNPIPGTNIANIFRLVRGNVQKGFSQADLVVENEYSMPMVSHVYMEPMTVVAHYQRDGRVDVWTSAQSPFTVRYLTSVSLGIPLQNIRVHVPYVGGGFGGKAGLNLEPLVILLSKLSGYRPVKLSLSREENFTSAAVRVGLHARIKTGVSKDGRMIAEEIRYVFDAGAYADYAVNVGRAAGYAGVGPYEIPNVKVESYTVYTNKTYATAFRGFGHMELHWCVERQMDIVARKLGIDPVEFRLKNLHKPGKSITATGVRVREDAGRPDLCLKAVAEALGWGKPREKPDRPWKYRGIGLAVFMKGPAQPPNSAASAIIRFNEDGSATLHVGTTEIGQGTLTALAQLAAEELGIPLEMVRVSTEKDTLFTAYTWQTVGSRSLFMDGNAVIMAARDARRQILERAAKVLKAEPSELEIVDGVVRVKGKPWMNVAVKDLAMGYTYPDGTSIGGPVIGRGWYIARHMTNLDPETGQGSPTIFETYGCQGVEIEVDVLTGEVRVLRIVSAFDIGKAVNPLLVEGQIVGGSVMAMSIALMEELKYGDGRMLNPNLTDYKIARAGDVPKEFRSIIIETPQLDGPYGARGIGELTMIGVPAAIGNAIFDAVGVEVRSMPLSGEHLWMEILRQKPELLRDALEKLGVSGE